MKNISFGWKNDPVVEFNTSNRCTFVASYEVLKGSIALLLRFVTIHLVVRGPGCPKTDLLVKTAHAVHLVQWGLKYVSEALLVSSGKLKNVALYGGKLLPVHSVLLGARPRTALMIEGFFLSFYRFMAMFEKFRAFISSRSKIKVDFEDGGDF